MQTDCKKSAPQTLNLQFEKRFSRNLSSNIIYFLINVVLGLVLVPFFLDTLGEAAYGLIPLATSITSYVTMVIDSLSTSISRFLTIDIQQNNMEKANETYNTALFGTLAIILLLVPVITAIAWLSPRLFDIGELASSSVFILFLLIFISVLIRSWSSNFMTVLFANNRLDLRNYVNIINVLLQFIGVVILFAVFSPSLEAVGLSYFLAAVAALLLSYAFSTKTSAYLKICIRSFSTERMKEIGGLSMWVIINTFGALLYTHIALFLVNILCGDVAGSQYAIAYTWFTLLYTIGTLVTNQFTPLIYAYYSGNQTADLIRFTQFSTKCTGLFMALPIGLACIFCPQLLAVWVGSEYSFLSLLVCIIVIPVIIHIQASCSYSVYVSTKNVQIPAIANFITGGIVIVLTLLFTLGLDWGMYGIALAVGTGMILRQGVFNPLYTAYVLKAPLTTYFKSIWVGVGGLGVLLLCGFVYTSIFPDITIWHAILAGLILSVFYMLSVMHLVMKKDERTLIRACLPTSLQRRIPSWLL